MILSKFVLPKKQVLTTIQTAFVVSACLFILDLGMSMGFGALWVLASFLISQLTMLSCFNASLFFVSNISQHKKSFRCDCLCINESST